MQKTLSVNAIENGTVIDHIPAGQGIIIIRLLKLAKCQHRVTIGFNLKSDRSGRKDLIKIEGRYLSEQEASHVALFAEQATINQIKDFTVIKKHDVEAPQHIEQLLKCPNNNCISNQEAVVSHFSLQQDRSDKLHCDYCEKTFSRQQVKEQIE